MNLAWRNTARSGPGAPAVAERCSAESIQGFYCSSSRFFNGFKSSFIVWWAVAAWGNTPGLVAQQRAQLNGMPLLVAD